MTNTEYISDLLAPYGPTLPVDTLVYELNVLYHAHEAAEYDDRHPEVHEQLPPIWAEMVGRLRECDSRPSWRILDFGCGTGFEATQILCHLGPECIRTLTCYDPSPEMRARCRSRLQPLGLPIEYADSVEAVLASGRRYDLVLTNSLLHHLPGPAATLAEIRSVIEAGAWWISGHEPSRRFFANRDCYSAYTSYSRQLRLSRLASPRAYCNRLLRVLSMDDSPATATALDAFRRGYFRRKPGAVVIDRIVDYHVPHSPDEAEAGRGFDYVELQAEMAPLWMLEWVKTYAFMGQHHEASLSPRWRKIAANLARLYPFDGANFCTMWRRA